MQITGLAPMVGHPLSMHKTLGSDPGTTQNGMVVQACDPSTWDVEVRGSEVQDQPPLHRRFKASLSHTALSRTQ